jgi:hypothetical protein
MLNLTCVPFSRTRIHPSSLYCSSYYLIGLPLGLLFAFHDSIHLGLAGLWLGLSISLVYCATIGVWICLRADWNWEVIVVTKRLKAAREAARKMAVGDQESEEDDTDDMSIVDSISGVGRRPSAYA